MANPALEDQALLQGLFQAPFSPLQNYGTGLIAVATAKRQREQELQDAARKRGEQVSDLSRQEQFTLNRDVARDAFQERRDLAQMAHEDRAIKLHADQQIRARTLELEALTKEKREERRQAEIDKAVSNGVKLSKDATLEEAIAANSAVQGRKLIAASKEASQALTAYSQYLGSTKQEVLADSMASAISSVDPKALRKSGLSLTELNSLVTNPSSMADLRARAARSGNKQAFSLLNEINSTAIGNMEAGMKLAEANKPALAGLSASFKIATDNFQNLAKVGGVSEADSIEATKNLIQSANQPPAAPTGQVLPPPPIRTGAPGAVAPAQPQQFPGILPPVGRAISSAVKPLGTMVGNVGQNVSSLLFGGDFVDPMTGGGAGSSLFAPPATNAPPAIQATNNSSGTSLPLLFNLRLQKSLQDQAALQNQIAPTFAPLHGAGASW